MEAAARRPAPSLLKFCSEVNFRCCCALTRQYLFGLNHTRVGVLLGSAFIMRSHDTAACFPHGRRPGIMRQGPAAAGSC